MNATPCYYAKIGFETQRFGIAAALAGQEHRFSFEGATVSVRLPARAESGRAGDERLLVTSWLTTTDEPIAYEVRDVRIVLTPADSAALVALLKAVPSEVGRPIAAGMLGTETLDREIAGLGEVAKAAGEHWLRTLRWRTKRWFIGRPRRGPMRISGTSLHDLADDQLVASDQITFSAGVGSPTSEAQWADVQQRLTRGEPSPLFYDLFFDGEEHLAVGDYRRAVIDFAVACEVLFKTLLDKRIPSDLFDSARDHLLRTQARSLIGRRFAEPLLGLQWIQQNRPTMRVIGKLFDARNDVMHSHRQPVITRSDCAAFRDATRSLLAAASPE